MLGAEPGNSGMAMPREARGGAAATGAVTGAFEVFQRANIPAAPPRPANSPIQGNPGEGAGLAGVVSASNAGAKGESTAVGAAAGSASWGAVNPPVSP